MTKLNRIGLRFTIDKDKSLGFQVTRALDSWNKNIKLRDYLPEFIVLPIDGIDKEIDDINGLEVEYSKYVQRNTFQIEADV